MIPGSMNQRKILRFAYPSTTEFFSTNLILRLIFRDGDIKSITLARQSSSATTVAFDNPARLRTKTD